MINKKFIEEINLKGKHVLTRVDFNVPLNSELKIMDNGRISAALPTIRHIIKHGGKVILMSHLGRPLGERVESLSLKPVADELSKILGERVDFIQNCIGEVVENKINSMQNGEVILLENLRFQKAETMNEIEFCKQLGKLADVFINDAFGTLHREHASTVGVTQFVDESAIGYLIQKELQFLGSNVTNPKRPFTAILGGAKVSDKIKVIERLIDKVETLIIGGGMACTFLKAKGYKIGASILEEDSIDYANQLIRKAKEKNTDLLLPIDGVIADHFDKNAKTSIVSSEAGAPKGWFILDIGPKSTEVFCKAIQSSRTILWNGPMGAFEIDKFSRGTMKIAQSLAEATSKGAITIIGGGDSASAIKKSGLSERISHVSTGGGASLKFLEGTMLPGVNAIQQSNL